jgi:hypothetical protein
MRQVRLGRQVKKLKADGTPKEETLPDGSKQGYGGTTYQRQRPHHRLLRRPAAHRPAVRLPRRCAARQPRRHAHRAARVRHVIAGRTARGRPSTASSRRKASRPSPLYAQRHPAKEFFEDAFDMFQNNPSWMVADHPRLHRWFQLLSTTGRVPTQLP